MRVHPIIAELRRIRREEELTQRDVEEMTGYRRESISRWEKGHRAPTITQLSDWSEALGCEVVVRRRRT